jgi:hypothetical protein
VYAVFGGDEGSKRDDMRTCFLLDMYQRLGKRKARVSTLSTELLGAACASAERLIRYQIPILLCASCSHA